MALSASLATSLRDLHHGVMERFSVSGTADQRNVQACETFPPHFQLCCVQILWERYTDAAVFSF
jgi:hypothetical protein